MALSTSGSGIVDGMAIGACGAMVIQAVYPAACVGVIKGGIPIVNGMTLGAGHAELSGMGRWLGVTGGTVGWRAFKNIIRMALGTSHSNMRPGQRERNGESKFIVRKVYRVNEC